MYARERHGQGPMSIATSTLENFILISARMTLVTRDWVAVNQGFAYSASESARRIRPCADNTHPLIIRVGVPISPNFCPNDLPASRRGIGAVAFMHCSNLPISGSGLRTLYVQRRNGRRFSA